MYHWAIPNPFLRWHSYMRSEWHSTINEVTASAIFFYALLQSKHLVGPTSISILTLMSNLILLLNVILISILISHLILLLLPLLALHAILRLMISMFLVLISHLILLLLPLLALHLILRSMISMFLIFYHPLICSVVAKNQPEKNRKKAVKLLEETSQKELVECCKKYCRC